MSFNRAMCWNSVSRSTEAKVSIWFTPFGYLVANRRAETFYPPQFAVTIEDSSWPMPPSIDKPTTVRKASTSGYSVPESDESDEYPDDCSEDDEMDIASPPTSDPLTSDPLPSVGITNDNDTAKVEPEATIGPEATVGSSQSSPIVIDDDIEEDSEHDEINIIPESAPAQSQFTPKVDEEKRTPLSAGTETHRVPFPFSSDAVLETYDTDHDDSDVILDSPYSESEIDESDNDIDDGTISATKFGVGIETSPPRPNLGINPSLDLAKCFPSSLLDEPPVQPVNLNRYQTGPFSCEHGGYTGGFYDSRPFPYYSQPIGYCSQFEPNREENITSSTFRQTQEALRKAAITKPTDMRAPMVKSTLSKSMSIENIINPESSLNKKRKFNDSMDIPDGQPHQMQDVADESSNPPTSRLSEPSDLAESFLGETELYFPRKVSTEVEDTPEDIEKGMKETMETPANATMQAPVLDPAQRPQKKRKTGFARGFFTGTAVGAVVGSIGVFAGLAAIPESFFTA